MTTGKVAGRILLFALPILFAEVLQEFHYTVDSFVAGNFLEHGDTVVAAIGATWHVLMLLLSFLLGFSIGGSVVIAQFVGSNKDYRLPQTITTLLVAVLVSAPIISVAGIAASRPLLQLLNVPPEVLPYSLAYLRIMLAGFTSLVGYSAISAVFRGLGDARTPLILVFFSLLLNTCLNLLLVIVFDSGITGLAISTIFAQALSFVLGLVLLIKQGLVPRKLREWYFNIRILEKVVKVAYPVGLDMMFTAGSILAISLFINRAGASVIAAVSIAQNFDELVMVASLSIAGAVSVFVAQNLAAGNGQRARKGARVGVLLAVACAVYASIMAYFSNEQVARMFTDNPEILRALHDYVMVIAMFYFLNSTTIVIGGALQGAGKTLAPMLASLVSLWLVRVPLTWLLSQKMGPTGIWYSQVLAWIICYAIILIYYFRVRKKIGFASR